MSARLVKSMEQAKASIARFNADLPNAPRLNERLTYNRAWYYDPDSDLVGPSKFIGYANMTASRYVEGWSFDGRQTEPVLLKVGFTVLEQGSPEEAHVRAKVEALCAKYGKRPNDIARYCAPVGWKVAPARATPLRQGQGSRTIHATITPGESSGFVAECDRLAVVTQGETVDETIANLKEAVALHLEGEDLAALGLANDPVILISMEVLPWAA